MRVGSSILANANTSERKPPGGALALHEQAVAFGAGRLSMGLSADQWRAVRGVKTSCFGGDIFNPGPARFQPVNVPEKGLVREFVTNALNTYGLLEPGLSRDLLLEPRDLATAKLDQVLEKLDSYELTRLPLYDPLDKDPKHDWLPRRIGDNEQAGIRKNVGKRRFHDYVISIPSAGASPDMTYFYWWMRDGETTAKSLLESPDPDERALGAALTRTNLKYFVSGGDDSQPQSHNASRIIPMLRSDALRDQIRRPTRKDPDALESMKHFEAGQDPDALNWQRNTLMIKQNPKTRDANAGWPQLQFDAVGMHLGTVAEHLKSGEFFGWKNLSKPEKDGIALLYAFLLRGKYWNTADSGAWEYNFNQPGIRSSSVGMATNGMIELQGLLFNHPDGKAIRSHMVRFLKRNVLKGLPRDVAHRREQELIAPLKDEAVFEEKAVVPGLRRLYLQLPGEGGLENNRHAYELDSASNRQPYSGQNKIIWDSATVLLTRYAPTVLKTLADPEVQRKYLADMDIGPQLRKIREQYGEGDIPERDFAGQILNAHMANLRRESGIIRHQGDHYQNKYWHPDQTGPLPEGAEAQWAIFPGVHGSAWLKRYLETGDEKKLERGLDAVNLAVSSLVTFSEGEREHVRIMESVIPHRDGKKADLSHIPDLAWSLAELKAAVQLLPRVAEKYRN